MHPPRALVFVATTATRTSLSHTYRRIRAIKMGWWRWWSVWSAVCHRLPWPERVRNNVTRTSIYLNLIRLVNPLRNNIPVRTALGTGVRWIKSRQNETGKVGRFGGRDSPWWWGHWMSKMGEVKSTFAPKWPRHDFFLLSTLLSYLFPSHVDVVMLGFVSWKLRWKWK